MIFAALLDRCFVSTSLTICVCITTVRCW